MDTFYVTSKSAIFKNPKANMAEFVNAKCESDARQEVASYRHTKKVLSVTKLTKKTMTAEMFRLALAIPRGDAEEILEHVADALLSAGMTKESASPSLRAATKRLLQLAASDINLAVPTKLLDAEVALIAQKVLDAVEVTDPALVPSVSKRRGLPAGVAEKAA